MRLVTKHNVSYHIKVAGEGDPLLLLHGFTGSGETWNSLIPLLKDQYRLVIPDIIGHGQTSSPDNVKHYNIEQVAADLKYILENLSISHAHILGYSMGGRLALSFSCLYPSLVKSLILESSSPGLRTEKEQEERKQKDRRLAEKIKGNGMKSFVKAWENLPLFESQKRLPLEKQAAIRDERLKNSPLGLVNSLLGMGTGSQPSWWDTLSFLQFSVLLLTGELDTKFCKIAQEMIRSIKFGEWKTIPDTGHAIHVEDEEKFGKIVKEFLTRQKGGND